MTGLDWALAAGAWSFVTFVAGYAMGTKEGRNEGYNRGYQRGALDTDGVGQPSANPKLKIQQV